jgi:hypothetical protein
MRLTSKLFQEWFFFETNFQDQMPKPSVYFDGLLKKLNYTFAKTKRFTFAFLNLNKINNDERSS